MSYLKLITPTNLVTERARFFASKHYEPQLEYDWSEANIANFLTKTPQGQPLVNALLSQDEKTLTRAAADFFDVKFRPADIEFAKDLTTTIPPATNGTAKTYAALMRQKLQKLGIDYQVLIVDEHGFQGRPNHQKHILKLSKYLHLQFLTLDGITNHELVHIVRAINGDFNHIPISSDYLPTEEGLACLIQDELLTHPTASSFQHALEYLAANLSQTASFREIYNFLIAHGSDPENAWLRGIRQKFGLKDTSRPGGLVKSGMYFYHELLLCHLSQDELLRLFVGKISLAELPNYPQYIGQVPRDIVLRTLFPSSGGQ